MGELSNKVAVLTGAGRGIGAACARALAAEGMHLALLARTLPQLEALAAECRSAGVRALPVVCDVTKVASVDAAIKTVIAEFGSIDLLINNAGVGHYGRFLELNEAQWDDMVSVNLKGPFLMLQAVLPHMVRAKRGMVMAISSTRGYETMATTPGYSATKFALMGLHSALTQDLKDHGIRVSVICPAGVLTDFRGIPAAEKDPNMLSTEDVARAVVYAAKAPYPTYVSQVNLYSLR